MSGGDLVCDNKILRLPRRLVNFYQDEKFQRKLFRRKLPRICHFLLADNFLALFDNFPACQNREDLDDVVLFGSDHLRRPSVANMSDLELIAY